MPMEKAGDFPMGDRSKDYHLHCAWPDGTTKSYEEALAGMTQFIVKTQGLDESVARDAAKNMMAKLPA